MKPFHIPVQTETVEEPIDEEAEAESEKTKEGDVSEDEVDVEEEEEEDKDKPKTKKVGRYFCKTIISISLKYKITLYQSQTGKHGCHTSKYDCKEYVYIRVVEMWWQKYIC